MPIIPTSFHALSALTRSRSSISPGQHESPSARPPLLRLLDTRLIPARGPRHHHTATRVRARPATLAHYVALGHVHIVSSAGTPTRRRIPVFDSPQLPQTCHGTGTCRSYQPGASHLHHLPGLPGWVPPHVRQVTRVKVGGLGLGGSVACPVVGSTTARLSAAGRVVRLDAGPAGSTCSPAALWGVLGLSRPGDTRGVGDLDLDADAARRVVVSTTARCSAAGCAMLAGALGRSDLAAALWVVGEGWCSCTDVSSAVRFRPPLFTAASLCAAPALRMSGSTCAGSTAASLVEPWECTPTVGCAPFSCRYSCSRFALRRCAELGPLALCATGALAAGCCRRLVDRSWAVPPLGSCGGLCTANLKTIRTPRVSTEYASYFFPMRTARATSRHAGSPRRSRRGPSRLLAAAPRVAAPAVLDIFRAVGLKPSILLTPVAQDTRRER